MTRCHHLVSLTGDNLSAHEPAAADAGGGAIVGLVVVFAVIVVPVLFGGVGLVVMLTGKVVGLDLSDGWIIGLAVVPTAVLTVKFWRVAVTPTEGERYR